MPNDYFEFKQFIVKQDKCAMKVGTDSVLLGAWCVVKSKGRILDIGTGSGILSLMLAQQYHNIIDAIEIDKNASIQAGDNFNCSPWSSRLTVINNSFQDFVSVCEYKYDMIISNPPYFNTGIQSNNEFRAKARHDKSLSLNCLLKFSAQVLNPSGTINLILPYDNRRLLIEEMLKHNLWLSRELLIKPNPKSMPERIIVELSSKMPEKVERDEIFIEFPNRGGYSDEFIKLTKAYYLKI